MHKVENSLFVPFLPCRDQVPFIPKSCVLHVVYAFLLILYYYGEKIIMIVSHSQRIYVFGGCEVEVGEGKYQIRYITVRGRDELWNYVNYGYEM